MECIACLQNRSLALHVYVQPRASVNKVAGIHGNALKICLTAPPVENKANEALIQFIADLLGVNKSKVSIKSGRQSRKKKVLITSCSLEEAEKILSRALSNT